MSEPRVLALGDSFIRCLRLFLSRDSHCFTVDFKLSHRAFIKWYMLAQLLTILLGSRMMPMVLRLSACARP